MRNIVYCTAKHRFDGDRARIAVEGLRICEGCRVGIRKDLDVLERLWRDLNSGVATSLSGGLSRKEPLVSGTRVPGITYDAAALNCAQQMSRDMEYFAAQILGVQNLILPRAVTVLLRESDRVAGHELAPMVREVLRSLVGAAYNILDPAGRPKEVGPCPEMLSSAEYEGRCTGTLYMRGEGARAELSCHACGSRIPQRAWKRYAQKYAAAMSDEVELKGNML